MKDSFKRFLDVIFQSSQMTTFVNGASNIEAYVDNLEKNEFIEIAEEIGTIPESINASSTEEKMFSKASDIVLARCFRELGMRSKAVTGRGDSADVIAESIHGYSLVADAKAFRLSRTAKNQKDFKVGSLSSWRGSEHDYAVLVAPYFQYPISESQIYFDPLEKNVCILSWEHILFLIKNNKIEDINFNLENIWDAPKRIQRDHNIQFTNRKMNLFPYTNEIFIKKCNITNSIFNMYLNECKRIIVNRSIDEKQTITNEINEITSLTREEAINKLLAAKKTTERIDAIDRFISSL